MFPPHTILSIVFLLHGSLATTVKRRNGGFLKLREKFDAPFCKFGPKYGFNSSVAVWVSDDNTRSFAFGTDDFGTQTEIACAGPVPASCERNSAEATDVPSCESLDCPCEPDTSSLDFGYMKKMMDEAIPKCESKTSGFHALVIGLGGGAIPGYLSSHCPAGSSVESIEYDARVIEAATHFFGLRVAPGVSEVYNNDGGSAVQSRKAAQKKYDLILVDCFQADGFVPESCRSKTFVSGLHSILTEGGTVIQQVWANQYEGTLLTYQQSFGNENVHTIDMALHMNFLIKASA